MRETCSTRTTQLAGFSRMRSTRRPELGEPPVARLGSMAGMPRAIFTEDDDTTLTDLLRIDRKASPISQQPGARSTAK